jgi:transposase-like protein
VAGPRTRTLEAGPDRFRQACRRRGHLPDELSALKVLYLVIATPRNNRTNVNGGTPGWKDAINALTMYYGDRITLSKWRSPPHTKFLTVPQRRADGLLD